MKKKSLLIYVNPKSSDVKEFKLSPKKILLSLLIAGALFVISIKYSVDFIVDFSQNSKISHLKYENTVLQSELNKISEKIAEIRSTIDVLESKDDKIRAILDLPEIDPDVRQVGIGGTATEPALAFNAEGLSFANELISNLSVLEKLEREIRLETESYQKLLTTVERRQDSLLYLPILQPVHNAYLSSGFGNRRHPINRRMQFHKGVDLATNSGTPIIAPADGYVVVAERNGGYGLFVAINHKYGFETYYGHMRKIFVKKGQFVKRGDKLGEVGSTGLATSSHLHYEVHYKGKPLNPLNFFLNDGQF